MYLLNKKLIKHLIYALLILFLISCPNDQMRNLVEIKVSDPVPDTFIINSGAPTASLTVTLNSLVTKDEDALEMRFKNESGDWSTWESYSNTKKWNLSIGDGLKTVYAEYRDEGHHVVSMLNTIVLNTGAPAGEFYIWGSAISGNQHLYVNSSSVTLCMTISNVEQMRFSNNGGTTWSSWIPYSDTFPWDIASGDGLKTVNAEFQTNAGTITPSARNITLDTTLPAVSSFRIENDAATANNIGVSLDYDYTEINTVWAQYMNDSESWSSMEALSGSPVTKNWSLRSQTGDRTVSVKLTDIAGNTSSAYSDTIYLSTAAPAPPDITSTTPTGDTTPTWSWNNVTGAVSYNYRLDSGSQVNTTATSFTAPTLSYGDHTLAVSSIDIAGNESAENTFAVSIIQPPDTPTGLSIGTRTSSSLAVSWNTAARAVTYSLYRDTSPSGSFATLVYSGGGTAYTDTGLSTGNTYYYKVRASNTGGDSALSASVNAPTIPASPPAPSVSSATTTSLYINWNAVTGASSYQVFVDNSSTGTFVTEVYSGSSTGFTLSPLDPGRIYYFKVRATNISGSSPLSGATQGNTTLSTPSGFSVSKGTSTTAVNISWTAVSGANQYYLDRRTLSGSFAPLINISGTSYQDTSASPGITYYYRVRARSAFNIYSSYSAESGGYRGVAGGLPNLTLTLIFQSRTSTRVDSIYRITNSGNASADLDGPDNNDLTDTVAIQNYYSGDSIWNNGDERAAGGGTLYLGLPESFPVLLPGEHYDYNYYASGANTSGEYVFADLDIGNDVVESNESDNMGSLLIP